MKLLAMFLWALVVQVRGPDEVKVGELLTLESASKDAVKTKWLIPAGLKFISSGNKLHIVAEEAKTYTVTFIGVDKSYAIEATTHTFVAEQKE